MDKEEIINGIKNPKLANYYLEFPKLSGLEIIFNELIGEDAKETRARFFYNNHSKEFHILLRKDYKEDDLAHEIIHGKIEMLDKYGIMMPQEENYLIRLLHYYLEDMIVFKKMIELFDIKKPYDNSLISTLNGYVSGLLRNTRGIRHKYWSNKCNICDMLWRALLYFQSWYLKNLIKTNDFDSFLQGFLKYYKGKEEILIANKFIDIFSRNNSFLSKDNYEIALSEIIKIFPNHLSLSKNVFIKHFEKINADGYVAI